MSDRQPLDPAALEADVLITLFADRFFPASKGIAAPASGRAADTVKLAEGVWSIALADLVRRGAIGINAVEQKKLFVKTTKLVVSAGTEPSGLRADSTAGFLWKVVAAHRADKDPLEVKALVRAALGADTPDPWRTTIGSVFSDLMAAGLGEIHDQKKDGVQGRVGLKERVTTWQTERIAALAPAAMTAQAEYQAWQASTPLTAEIAKQIHEALVSRVKEDDDDDD